MGAGPIAQLLERPALHSAETGFRVDGKTQWLHVVSDGSLTLKRLHRKFGGEVIGIIQGYSSILTYGLKHSARRPPVS